MKEKDKLDRIIDAHLEDKQTRLGPDFTARVLERVRLDREYETQIPRHRPWWIPFLAAAAIALAVYLPQNEVSELNQKPPNLVPGQSTTGNSPVSSAETKMEMEEIFVMEESLRDFEILLDDNALDILALLEE